MYGMSRDFRRGRSISISRSLSTASRWVRKRDSPANPAPDSRRTVPPARRHSVIWCIAAHGIATAAGTMSTGGCEARPADASAYPAIDSRNEQCSARSSTTTAAAPRLGQRRLGNATVSAPVAQLRNSRRPITISELPGDQPVHRLRGVEELLIRRVAVAGFHLRDEPAVITHLGHRGADRGPVVVTQEQIRIDALIAAAAAVLQHILQMNARDPRPMDLDPLLGKSRVVDVADVEVKADRGTVHVVQELPELPRADKEAVLGVAVLASEFDARAGGFLTQWLQRIDAALIDLVVRHFLRHDPRDDQDRVGAEQSRGIDLALHDARRLGPDAGIARGQRRCPVQSRRDVGDDETHALDFPPQLPHLRVGGRHLKPRDIPQPQLDAVEPGALHELEAALQSPVLRDHVVADGFFHRPGTLAA